VTVADMHKRHKKVEHATGLRGRASFAGRRMEHLVLACVTVLVCRAQCDTFPMTALTLHRSAS
jgi:hypothetical protein